MTGGGGTKTGWRTGAAARAACGVKPWNMGLAFAAFAALAAALVRGDGASLAAAVAAAGLVAVAGFWGGLVAVCAKVEAANAVRAPTSATRTIVFMGANLRAMRLYCNKWRTP